MSFKTTTLFVLSFNFIFGKGFTKITLGVIEMHQMAHFVALY